MMSMRIFVFACLVVNAFCALTIYEKGERVFHAMDLWWYNDKLGGREQAKFFKGIDCDGDDKITEDEVYCIGKFITVGSVLWTFLKNADSNKDNLVSKTEYTDYIKSLDTNVEQCSICKELDVVEDTIVDLSNFNSSTSNATYTYLTIT